MILLSIFVKTDMIRNDNKIMIINCKVMEYIENISELGYYI